jgi:hypothetical protein
MAYYYLNNKNVRNENIRGAATAIDKRVPSLTKHSGYFEACEVIGIIHINSMHKNN